MTYSDFYTAYQAATSNAKALIDSDQIGLFVERELIEKTGLDAALKQKLIVLVSNIVVGLHSHEELPQLLQYLLPSTKVVEAEGAIKQFVANQQSSPPDAHKTGLSEDIAELEKAQEELQSVRTMSGDMEAHRPASETTHQSSQDHILKGAGQSDNTPRWGSES